jgi:hypothetical protein
MHSLRCAAKQIHHISPIFVIRNEILPDLIEALQFSPFDRPIVVFVALRCLKVKNREYFLGRLGVDRFEIAFAIVFLKEVSKQGLGKRLIADFLNFLNSIWRGRYSLILMLEASCLLTSSE